MQFEYTNSLSRPFGSQKKIKAITFPIGRYGEVMETLEFPEPVSEQEAIARVQAYMSQPFDGAHYDRVKDDLFVAIDSKAKALQQFRIRGDCLGDCTFLEVMRTDALGVCRLECGS